jgi:hypothetical protein
LSVSTDAIGGHPVSRVAIMGKGDTSPNNFYGDTNGFIPEYLEIFV